MSDEVELGAPMPAAEAIAEEMVMAIVTGLIPTDIPADQPQAPEGHVYYAALLNHGNPIVQASGPREQDALGNLCAELSNRLYTAEKHNVELEQEIGQARAIIRQAKSNRANPKRRQILNAGGTPINPAKPQGLFLPPGVNLSEK